MHPSDDRPLTQDNLRAIARAQHGTAVGSTARMVIMGALLESLTAQEDKFARPYLRVWNDHEIPGLQSLIRDARQGYRRYFARRKPRDPDTEETVCHLGHAFDDASFYLSAPKGRAYDYALHVAQKITAAAIDFNRATRTPEEGEHPHKMRVEDMYRHSPFTAFAVGVEIMGFAIPRIEENFPGIVRQALGLSVDDFNTTILAHRTLFREAQSFRDSSAEDMAYACDQLARMAGDIEKMLGVLPASRHGKMAKDPDFIALMALRGYIKPYQPDDGGATPAPKISEDRGKYRSMEEYRRDHRLPGLGRDPAAP